MGLLNRNNEVKRDSAGPSTPLGTKLEASATKKARATRATGRQHGAGLKPSATRNGAKPAGWKLALQNDGAA